MTRGTLAAAVLLSALAAACATTTAIPPSVGGLRYPDYLYPAPFDRAGDQRLRARHEDAWHRLQSGEIRVAEAAFADIVKQHPAYYPAAVGWGYALVAEGRPGDALARFDDAIRRAPRYAPALAGRAEALLAAGQREAALAEFEAALASDSTLDELRRRIDVLRFDRVREQIAAATRAAASGRLDEARDAYAAAIAASPESAFLYRDLGLVELRRKDLPAAEKQLERAVALDPGDVPAHVGLAEVFEESGDFSAAIAALEHAYELEPSEAVRLRLDRVRERAESGALPAEYRNIGGLDQVTRGDLAALVGVRLGAVLAANRSRASVLATDIRGHWASTWILSVIRSGVMDVFPNHTFQPRGTVRRAALAQVVSRVLAISGSGFSRGTRSRVAFGDVSLDHLNYADISTAVASGAMTLEGGFFKPSRVVGGQEAVETIQRLERLARNARSGDR